MDLVLQPTRLHWLADDGRDHPEDLCAHSPVAFEIDDARLVAPDDGVWTVSASAIYLLRSLTEGHQSNSGFGSQLFPCCGHGIFDGGDGRVEIIGCSNGIDFEITKQDRDYIICSSDLKTWKIGERAWRDAVIEFSGLVRRFYCDASPKEPTEVDEKAGFQAMIREWDERAERAKAEQ